MTPNLMRRTAATTGVAWCAVGRLAGAQLPGTAVDPHMVVLTPARPAGEVTVFNPRPMPAEFTVDLRFGYVTTDSSGTPKVELRDGPDSASAAEWITPYPRHFSLLPGMSQVVRLLARPPAAIPDGEYWARLTVHSHDISVAGASVAGAALPIASPRSSVDSSTPRMALRLETATVLPVFFRKGRVSTGVAVEALHAAIDGDSIEVQMTLRRTGNAAFIGVAQIALIDEHGREALHAERQLAVYISATTRLRIPLPPVTRASPHTVRVMLSTQRRDVPLRLVLQAEPIRLQAAVALPEQTALQ